MDNRDANKLIEDALSVGAPSDEFRRHLLRNSAAAFTRGRVLRRRLRTAGFTSLILLVAGAAFFWGRLSVPNQALNRQALARSDGEQAESINVSRELVVWLDAARFFKQLGMEERAELSYKQASALIPPDVAFPQQAGLEVQSMFADMSCDGDFETLTRIMAQSFGG